MREQGEDREHGADRDQGAAGSEQVEQDRRRERTEPHRDDHDQLEEAEDTTEQPLVDVLLHAREARDVEEAVGEAGYGEGDEGNSSRRPDSDQRERQAPAGERKLKRSAEATATDERDSGHCTGEAAETEGRHERAHSGLADSEHVDRDDDEDHTEHATHEGLGAEERDDEPHRAVAASSWRPSRNSPTTPGRTPAPVDGAPARIPAIAANERNEIAAQAPKTAAGPDTASSTAAARGPASTAADSSVSAATFDADSSRGDRASSGTSARWQGRWAANGTAASTADT